MAKVEKVCCSRRNSALGENGAAPAAGCPRPTGPSRWAVVADMVRRKDGQRPTCGCNTTSLAHSTRRAARVIAPDKLGRTTDALAASTTRHKNGNHQQSWSGHIRRSTKLTMQDGSGGRDVSDFSPTSSDSSSYTALCENCLTAFAFSLLQLCSRLPPRSVTVSVLFG
jgi:hypothetical protein